MRSPLLLLVVAASCTNEEPPSIGGGSVAIQIHAPGAVFAASHDGRDPTGPWTPLQVGGFGSIVVPEDHFVGVVCVSDDQVKFTAVLGHGAGVHELPCEPPQVRRESALLTLRARSNVEITIGQTVAVGGEQVVVPEGTYDVVAIDRDAMPPRFRILRGIEVDGDRDLEIDMTSAVAMQDTTVTFMTDGLDRDSLGTVFTTARGTTVIDFREVAGDVVTTLPTFPAASLVDGDRMVVGADSVGDDRVRFERLTVADGRLEELAVPSRVDAEVAWDDELHVRFTPKPDLTNYQLTLSDPSVDVAWSMRVSPGENDADVEQTFVLPDPTTAPGWDPAWTLRDPVSWQFKGTHDEDGDEITSLVNSTLD